MIPRYEFLAVCLRDDSALASRGVDKKKMTSFYLRATHILRINYTYFVLSRAPDLGASSYSQHFTHKWHITCVLLFRC